MVLPRLEDSLLVMNGDLLTSLNYRKMYQHHQELDAAATIGLFARHVSIDFGVIEADEQQRLTNYTEKPTYNLSVSMGINIFKKDVVSEFVPPGVRIDIPELMLRLKEAGHQVQCYQEECLWLDIGRVDDYEQASATFEERRNEFLPGESS